MRIAVLFCVDLDVHPRLCKYPSRDIATPDRFRHDFGLYGLVPAEKRFLISQSGGRTVYMTDGIAEYGSKDSRQCAEVVDFIRRHSSIQGRLTEGPSSLVELGCLTAPFGRRLLDEYPGVSATGVDISAESISNLKAIVARDGIVARYVALRASILDPDLFQPGTFDVVLCPMVLHHFIRLHRTPLPANILRWLKPGGLLLLYEPNGSNPAIRVSSAIMHAVVSFIPRLRFLKCDDETVHGMPYYCRTFEDIGMRLLAAEQGHKHFEWHAQSILLVNLRNTAAYLVTLLTWGRCRGTTQLQLFRKAE